MYLDDAGALIYRPTTESADLYVLGYDNVKWIDIAAGLIFVGVLFGVAGHGSLRYAANRKLPAKQAKVKRVYMYAGDERLWHWCADLHHRGAAVHRVDHPSPEQLWHLQLQWGGDRAQCAGVSWRPTWPCHCSTTWPADKSASTFLARPVSLTR